ncbi:MAG TPA: alpha-L-fucosidase [Anaerohalosphaeraceae bacterium]|nr:alpha-L-fucosidase [Anaerohalosphaeraceae bacterium]HOL32468.1 alpha-L-fucosidase [Anaerohalosphaeraceae bacterium]HOM75241.1 alpha-L-fucosidase [Anaerohalosphaeraceae bacterium]HPC64526.1 alpha-L-fucosidase [Anaerohalosphaeraceae bacterium]HPO69447.1 alpha-L-fucosidase [Anaerohalosphaeraceae bacterium]
MKCRFVQDIAGLVLILMTAGVGHAEHRASWMQKAKWGVMNHYLADWIAKTDNIPMSVERWNQLVDNFDVEGLAEQVKSVGAGYYIITIGQNSGYYLAPNPVYDQLTGIQPSKCSRRDLVSDLSAALTRRGIRLIVYLPAGAPSRDRLACQTLQWKDGADRNLEFQLRWEKIIRDWSIRWGDKVSGWWFDGCYWPNTMYRYEQPPNFASFAAAARAGNSASIVAFNPGVVDRIISVTPHEDYSAGEINEPERLMIRRSVDGLMDGSQVHVLSYLGQTWGMGQPRFSAEQVSEWSRRIVQYQGAVTWDVPIQPSGLMAQVFMDQLKVIGAAVAAVNPEISR